MQSLTKFRQSYLAIPALVLAAIVLPVAFAGAAGGSTSVNQLKKQVKTLKQQVAALQGQANSPRPPGGPAGGDLTGAFPNPLIGPNAVGAGEIQKDAVTTEEIKDEAVTGAEIKSGTIDASHLGAGSVQGEEMAVDSVGGEEIVFAGVGKSEISSGAVGAAEFGAVKTAVSPIGATVGAGQTKGVQVTCPGETVLIAGGFAWADDEPNSIIYSAPSEVEPGKTWVVRGHVPTGSNVLYAWATCLQV